MSQVCEDCQCHSIIHTHMLHTWKITMHVFMHTQAFPCTHTNTHDLAMIQSRKKINISICCVQNTFWKHNFLIFLLIMFSALLRSSEIFLFNFLYLGCSYLSSKHHHFTWNDLFAQCCGNMGRDCPTYSTNPQLIWSPDVLQCIICSLWSYAIRCMHVNDIDR